MIKINAIYNNEQYEKITIKGHAKFAEYGKDIVCASVSSIVITTINALLKYDESCITYSQNDGLLDLTVLKNDNIVNILITNMLDLLKELELNYPKNLKIK